MRNKILAIAAITGAISAPFAAQAQTGITSGVVRGGSVVVEDVDGIAVDQRPAFQEYVIRERVPNYTIPDRVIVGIPDRVIVGGVLLTRWQPRRASAQA